MPHVLVVRDPGAEPGDPGGLQATAQLVVQGPDDRADVLRGEARGDRAQFRDPNGGDLLDDDVLGGHASLALDGLEPRADLGEPCPCLRQGRFELGLAQTQHAPQFVRVDLLVEDRADLFQGEAEVLERNDAVEQGELVRRVEAVARVRVDPGRAQQSDGVVVAQHPDRHPPVPGEVSDGEHDDPYGTASHGVRVKRHC